MNIINIISIAIALAVGFSMSMIKVLSDQGKQGTENLFDELWEKSSKLL